MTEAKRDEFGEVRAALAKCIEGERLISRYDRDSGEISYQVQVIPPGPSFFVYFNDSESPKAKFEAELYANSLRWLTSVLAARDALAARVAEFELYAKLYLRAAEIVAPLFQPGGEFAGLVGVEDWGRDLLERGPLRLAARVRELEENEALLVSTLTKANNNTESALNKNDDLRTELTADRAKVERLEAEQERLRGWLKWYKALLLPKALHHYIDRALRGDEVPE